MRLVARRGLHRLQLRRDLGHVAAGAQLREIGLVRLQQQTREITEQRARLRGRLARRPLQQLPAGHADMAGQLQLSTSSPRSAARRSASAWASVGRLSVSRQADQR